MKKTQTQSIKTLRLPFGLSVSFLIVKRKRHAAFFPHDLLESGDLLHRRGQNELNRLINDLQEQVDRITERMKDERDENIQIELVRISQPIIQMKHQLNKAKAELAKNEQSQN